VQERGALAPLRAQDASPGSELRRRYRLAAVVAATVVAVDQLTKWWAVDALADRPITLMGPIRLTLSHNTGGAFGLGAGFLPFVALAVVALVIVLVSVGRAVASPAIAVALGLVTGGAFGNLADRLFRSPGLLRGAVVDFVDLRWWPVFNLADVAITAGCILLVLASFSRERPAPAR
jgi:signal peptidase II